MKDNRRNGDLFELMGMGPMFNDFSQLVNRMEKMPPMGMPFGGGRTDLSETDTEYVLEVELPGFKKENIKLEFVDEMVKISATREEEKKEYLRKERFSGKVERQIYLGSNVDETSIKAKFEDGVLLVTVPKSKAKETQSSITIE